MRPAAASPSAAAPFAGAESLRVRGEWALLAWSLASIVITAPILAWAFPILSSFKEIALLLIGAMIYVTFARGRLVGGSIRVHAGQFGHIHAVTHECARALRMSAPNVFVRDDPFTPIVAVGIGEPYSLIISAQWVDHLSSGELRFLIGRELAHIAAGHTRITSLLSVNGRENAIVSVLFGAWLRRIEYTADRAGLLCCGSLDDALAAVSVSTFHLVGRNIDVAAFAEQQREVEAERSLRVGEWISATPYATKRIAALRAFSRDGTFLAWSSRFETWRDMPFVTPPLPAGAVSRRAFGGFWRRCGALALDAIVVAAIAPAIPFRAGLDAADVPGSVRALLHRHPAFGAGLAHAGSFTGAGFMLLYIIVLVALTGQTLGMMVMDLRVVSDRFTRIGIGRAMWRYVCLIGSMCAVVGLLGLFRRVQPFEKWSGTRLIDGAAYARTRTRVTAPQLETAAP